MTYSSRYFPAPADAHAAWTKVKTSAMKRPYLDCGCRNDGRDTFLHLGCSRIACKEHADDPHECQHYEPESPPREEPPDVTDAFAALRSADRVTGDQVRLIDQALGRPDWAEVDEVLSNVARLDSPTFAVDASRDGISTVAMYDGTRYSVLDETHHVTQQQLEEAAQAATAAEARRIHERAFRRESLGEWPLDAQPEPDASPVDAALDRVQDRPEWWSTTGADLETRRPWWRFW